MDDLTKGELEHIKTSLNEIAIDLKQLRVDFHNHKIKDQEEKYKNVKAALAALGVVVLGILGYFIHNFIQFK